jgi:FMN-dependent NADH-azoreductase
MWNFGVPYVLKHYIDVITQPGLTFSFNPATGFSGLVTGRPATVISVEFGHLFAWERRGRLRLLNRVPQDLAGIHRLH